MFLRKIFYYSLVIDGLLYNTGANINKFRMAI